jgi:hypothetical protein
MKQANKLLVLLTIAGVISAGICVFTIYRVREMRAVCSEHSKAVEIHRKAAERQAEAFANLAVNRTIENQLLFDAATHDVRQAHRATVPAYERCVKATDRVAFDPQQTFPTNH